MKNRSVFKVNLLCTLRLFKEPHILNHHNFGDGKVRYKKESPSRHHLTEIETGHIIEFQDNPRRRYPELYGIALKRIEKKPCLS